MTEITTTSIAIHNAGDQKKVTAVATNIINAYTWTVPHLGIVEDWYLAPTTEEDWGGTVSGNIITFVTSTTIAGKIVAFGR